MDGNGWGERRSLPSKSKNPSRDWKWSSPTRRCTGGTPPEWWTFPIISLSERSKTLGVGEWYYEKICRNFTCPCRLFGFSFFTTRPGEQSGRQSKEHDTWMQRINRGRRAHVLQHGPLFLGTLMAPRHLPGRAIGGEDVRWKISAFWDICDQALGLRPFLFARLPARSARLKEPKLARHECKSKCFVPVVLSFQQDNGSVTQRVCCISCFFRNKDLLTLISGVVWPVGVNRDCIPPILLNCLACRVFQLNVRSWNGGFSSQHYMWTRGDPFVIVVYLVVWKIGGCFQPKYSQKLAARSQKPILYQLKFTISVEFGQLLIITGPITS